MLDRDTSGAAYRHASRSSSPPAPLGPYETAYDIRRGYDGPAPRRERASGDGEADGVLYFRGRHGRLLLP